MNTPADAVQNLPRRALPAGDRSVDSPIISRHVGCFSSEEYSIPKRLRQRLLRPIRANLAIAVRPARKRIILPVVEITTLKQVFQFLLRHTQQTAECLHTALDHIVAALSRKLLSTAERRPSSNDR